MSRSAHRHFRGDHRLSGLSTYDQQVIGQDSPVLYLPLYGTASGLLDQSGNGHNGTAVNSYTPTTFLNGDGATAFNGINQYVEVPNHAALSVPTTGILTVEAWMRPDVLTFPNYLSTGYIHWMGKGNNLGGSNGENEYMSRMYNLTTTDNPPRPNRISGYCFNLTGGLGAGSYFQDTVTVGGWIHYVLVINTINTSSAYPTGYTKVYKNGVVRDQDALISYNIVPTAGTNPFRIGTAEAVSFFQGAICKVAIYNYELSPTRIHDHYRRVVAPPAAGTANLIKNVGAVSTATAGTTLSLTVPAAGVSAGSTLLVKAAHAYTAGSPTMADSRGNIYTRDQTSPNASTTMRASIFTAQINSALQGGDTIQLTTSASVGIKMFSVDEFSGITFSSPLDVKNNASNTSTTPKTGSPITTTSADEIIQGFVAVNGPSTETYTEDTADYTTLTRIGTTTGTGDITINSAFKSVSSTGSYSYQPTLGTSESWIEIIASYKAGTPVVTPPVMGSAEFIQFIGSASSVTSGTTLTITVPAGGVPAGHTLIVRSLADYTGNGATVTDSRGNTYAQNRSAGNVGTTMRGTISSALIATALQAGDIITITWPSSIATRVALIDEFANVASPTTVDVQNGTSNTSTTPSTSVTTTNADDLIVGLVGVDGPSTETYTDDTIHQWSGLTRAGTTGGTTNRTVNGAYRSVGATGTYSYAPVLGTSESWIELAVAYKSTTNVVVPPTTGTATFVQNIGTATANTSGTTLTITVPAGGVPAGHTLVVRTLSDYTNNGPTITDSRGNTYNRDRQAGDASSTIRLAVYSCAVTTPLQAGDTITMTFTTVTSRAAVIDEFASVLSPIVVDVQNGKSGTGTLPVVSATTTHAHDLLIGAVGVAGDVSDSFTGDSADVWTSLTRVGTTGGTFANNRTINSAYRSVPGTGTYTYQPTLGTSSLWIAFFVAYEAS